MWRQQMIQITISLNKSDIMELIYLINKQRQQLIDNTYDDIEWDYYFSLTELEEKLVQ